MGIKIGSGRFTRGWEGSNKSIPLGNGEEDDGLLTSKRSSRKQTSSEELVTRGKTEVVACRTWTFVQSVYCESKDEGGGFSAKKFDKLASKYKKILTNEVPIDSDVSDQVEEVESGNLNPDLSQWMRYYQKEYSSCRTCITQLRSLSKQVFKDPNSKNTQKNIALNLDELIKNLSNISTFSRLERLESLAPGFWSDLDKLDNSVQEIRDGIAEEMKSVSKDNVFPSLCALERAKVVGTGDLYKGWREGVEKIAVPVLQKMLQTSDLASLSRPREGQEEELGEEGLKIVHDAFWKVLENPVELEEDILKNHIKSALKLLESGEALDSFSQRYQTVGKLLVQLCQQGVYQNDELEGLKTMLKQVEQKESGTSFSDALEKPTNFLFRGISSMESFLMTKMLSKSNPVTKKSIPITKLFQYVQEVQDYQSKCWGMKIGVGAFALTCVGWGLSSFLSKNK